MAKRKSKKTVESKEKRQIVEEFDGWALGEKVYGRRYKTDQIVHGDIHQLHPKDDAGPAATIYDELNGSFRTVLVSTLSRTKPKRKRKTALGKLYSKSTKR